MGNIPTHLQHWDDWRDGRQQRRRHAVLAFIVGLAGGIALFGASAIEICIR
jgi:hypothetical protein